MLLVRRAPRLEVYWVERSPLLVYLGGFHAFPGGRVGAEDGEVPVSGVYDAAEARRRAAAARELFEETGILLARPVEGHRGRVPVGDERLARRADVLEARVSFEALLAASGLEIDGGAFTPAGRWLSPPFTPRGFDTSFYLAQWPGGEEPCVVPGELASGEWVEPAEGLERWHRGKVLLATPVKAGLAALAEWSRDEGALEAGLVRTAATLRGLPEAQGGAVERIEVVPGVVLVPLPSTTIPPATHTNCLIVGEGECLLVDPGTDDAAALAELDAVLGRLEGRRVVAIAVTHRHRDHTAGADEMRRRLSVPLLAHPALAPKVNADRALADGETIELAAPSGAWRVRAHFTPGHTPDHVVFHEAERGVLVAGDLFSSLSTVVIDPPDGDLGAYMESLARVAAMPARIIFPGHGPPAGGPRERLLALREHRLERERRVVEALQAGAGTLDDLLPRAYADVDESQWKWGKRSLLAHLLALEKQGVARRAGSDENAAVWSLI